MKRDYSNRDVNENLISNCCGYDCNSYFNLALKLSDKSYQLLSKRAQVKPTSDQFLRSIFQEKRCVEIARIGHVSQIKKDDYARYKATEHQIKHAQNPKCHDHRFNAQYHHKKKKIHHTENQKRYRIVKHHNKKRHRHKSKHFIKKKKKRKRNKCNKHRSLNGRHLHGNQIQFLKQNRKLYVKRSIQINEDKDSQNECKDDSKEDTTEYKIMYHNIMGKFDERYQRNPIWHAWIKSIAPNSIYLSESKLNKTKTKTIEEMSGFKKNRIPISVHEQERHK
eukprot:360803_1